MKQIFLYIFLLITHISAFAQTDIEASVSKYDVKIGEPLLLNVEFNVEDNSTILYPLLEQKNFSGFNILNTPTFDTIEEGNKLQVKAEYRLATFTNDTVLLKAGPFIINTDTLFTSEFEIVVTLPNVDTAKAIKPIKEIKRPVYTWRDNIKTYLYIAAAIVLVAILLILFFWLKKRRGNTPKKITHEYVRPDIAASKRLNKLSQDALYKQNKHKEHYSELTDLLRVYIETVLNIQLFEKTSEEQLHEISATGKLSIQNIESLEHLFQQADLAKFAKYKVSDNNIHSHLGIAKACIEQLAQFIDNKEDKE